MRRTSYRRVTEHREMGLLGRLFSIALFIITIAAITALLLSLASPYIASTHGWFFPFIGLISPAIYISNLILALYFIIRWKWLFALPIIALLLIGVSRVPLYIKTPLTKDYGLESYKGCVKLMSYNIRGAHNSQWHSSVDQIAKYIKEQSPDIITFQEYSEAIKGKEGSLSKQLPKYRRAVYGSNAIYSRYPIIRKGDIFAQADSLGGRSMYADLLIGKDTIRVINNHLNSNLLENKDKAYLKAENLLRDTMRKERLGAIIKKFGTGSAERTAQVKVIRNSMESSPYRYVACGDLNDTPISFAYFELSRGMKDAFVECGNGYSYTYRGFANLLRIDYILTSDGITPKSYIADVEQVSSDHIPIIANLKIDNKP